MITGNVKLHIGIGQNGHGQGNDWAFGKGKIRIDYHLQRLYLKGKARWFTRRIGRRKLGVVVGRVFGILLGGILFQWFFRSRWGSSRCLDSST